MVLFYSACVALMIYGLIIARAELDLMRAAHPLPLSIRPIEKATVIVPARNEERFIGRCLEGLLDQDCGSEYYEILVVDDGSEDRTAEIVHSFSSRGVRYERLDADKQGKKAALAKGIALASHEIIITTDADCVHPRTWVSTLLQHRAGTQAELLAAPVCMRTERTFLERFQSLDFLSLQAITAAAVSAKRFNMCNGANLLYTRAAFRYVNGFQGIDHVASGDDVLLMEKIARAFPGKVQYCYSKDAVVETEPVTSWYEFFQQRIRWAGKSTQFSSTLIQLILLIVYLLNLIIFCMMFVSVIQPALLVYTLLVLVLKAVIEYSFMNRAALFFGKKALMKWFIVVQPLYTAYIVAAATLGFFRSYEWKGRRMR